MRLASLIVLLFVLTPLAGCMGSGTVQDVAAPAWHSGYAWSWNTTGQVREAVNFQAEGQEGIQAAEVRKIDPILETVEVLNTTTDFEGTPVYLVGLWASQAAGDQEICVAQAQSPDSSGSSSPQPESVCVAGAQNVRLTAVRQADLEMVPLSYGQSRECQDNDVCRYRLESIHPAGAMDEHPYLDFPLESGKQWGGELARGPAGDGGGPSGDGGLEWVYEARVVGSSSVRTPVGEVDTVKVELVKRPINIDEWIQELREEVAEDGGRIDELDYDVSWRQIIHYAPELETVARIEFLFEEDVVAAGQDNGQEFRFEQRVSRETLTVLTGAQLFTKPERDLDYIARVVGGQIPLADPAGHLPDPRRVEISIKPAQPNVNAAIDQTAGFNATVTDSTGNLTGVTVQWSVLDYQYQTVATGNGSSFSHDFDGPGLYAVQAEAVDEEGRVLASTQVPFEAYYEATWQNFQPVGVMFFNDQQRVAFPVLPGVESVDIVAEPQGPAAMFNQNRLLVYDAAGNSLPVTNNREVHMTDFSDAFVAEDPWNFQWQVNGVSVADDVEVWVLVRFTTDPLDASAEETFESQLPMALQDLVNSPDAHDSGIFA